MVYVSPQGLRRLPLRNSSTFLDLEQFTFERKEWIAKEEKRVLVYRLDLEDDGSLGPDKQLVRLPPPEKSYILRFHVRSGSLASHDGVLYTNYPIEGSAFDRKTFHSKRFPTDFSRPVFVDITINRSGVFDFYVEHHDVSDKTVPAAMSRTQSSLSHFTVDPLLTITPRRRILSGNPISPSPSLTLPLDGIVMETVLPKLLGTFGEWEAHIKSIAEIGYNMIHFLPMQIRGNSGSPYSIYDQLQFSPDLFDKEDQDKNNDEKCEIVKQKLQKIKTEYGIFSLADIVWNHTACNSQWLKEHPEAGYNLENSPHLIPAYELDTGLLKYSGDLKSLGLPTHINSESDLDAVIDGVKPHVINAIRLWEFYVINVGNAVDELRTALRDNVMGNTGPFSNIDVAHLTLSEQAALLSKKGLYGQDDFGQRFPKKINTDIAVGLIKRWSESKAALVHVESKTRAEAILKARTEARASAEAEAKARAEAAARVRAEAEAAAQNEVQARARAEAEANACAEAEKRFLAEAKAHAEEGAKARATYRAHLAASASAEAETRAAIERAAKRQRYPELDAQQLIAHIASDAVKAVNDGPLDAQEIVNKVTEMIVQGETEAINKDVNPSVVTEDDIETEIAILTLDECMPSIEEAIRQFEAVVNEINLPFYKTYDDDVAAILNNLRNRVKYNRLDDHGPKLGEIKKNNPLIETYFTRIRKGWITSEVCAVVNNGWIWNARPFVDHASKDSFSYLRREVIVWGDCVKLRYGKDPSESPWLWDHMTKYTELLASTFHGFRIDNCHSTPLHVAQYLLDAARRINPNLYVVAELFTGSEEMDVRFVSTLGLNSLIREAMQAWDPKELSRLVHRYGGKPVGSMDRECLSEQSKCTSPDGVPDSDCIVLPIAGSLPHAMFTDCTHDNETTHTKRTAEDTLSNCALVAMSCCASGSVKGYDEVYPTRVDLVGETRHYQIHEKALEVGICRVKKVLQHMHTEMSIDGYIEKHVHHENDYIVVHRIHPYSLHGFLVIVRCAFTRDPDPISDLSPIKLRGTSAELLFSVTLDVTERTVPINKKLLTGLPTTLQPLNAPIVRKLSDVHGSYSEIILPARFPSGSVMLLSTSVDSKPEGVDELVVSGAEEAFRNLNLVDLNIVLYRCSGEEKDVTPGHGVYHVPGYGDLPYCGIAGFMSVLKPIMKTNDLGHPLCENLREGYWALDYVIHRLDRHMSIAPNLHKLREWYDSRFSAIKMISNFLVPKYFALIIKTAYDAAVKRVIEQMSPFIQDGGQFIQTLALTAVQMYGTVISTGLHPTEKGPSMAAGLPHFTFRHMRCWGRDVFISLRGLFLTTGNFDAAKQHIFAFGSVLRHGIIPNLLDAGRFPRYNCRDASWWYVQAVQDYCNFAPEGTDILKECVKRRFPQDDEFVDANDPRAYAYKSSIAEIIQEIVQRHARGIHFREWNAGPDLDHAMKPGGFQIDVEVDWETGLLSGGNRWNCGTWMDKMGDSEKAGNHGEPATPRDGAAIEIIGLLKSSLRWLAKLHAEGVYPWSGIDIEANGERKLVTFLEWSDLIQRSFERCFYIPMDASDDAKYDVDSKLVRRRGIYKDSYKSSKGYTDYQLRPNYPIAMVMAPELFDEQHAMHALNVCREVLCGPMGMRTLDPADEEYRGDYENGNDGFDKSVAKGWNYHQGPEWLWCTGHFLRAYLYFDTRVGGGKENVHHTIHTIARHLLPHRNWIETSTWAGLPELTNKDGAVCRDGCPTQAWSTATLLDLYDDIRKMEVEQV